MTSQVFWLLCFAIGSSSSSLHGSLPNAEKPTQALSKDVFSPAPAQGKVPAQSSSSNAMGHWLLPPAHLQQPKPPGTISLLPDKRKRTESSLENSTGLRKPLWQQGWAVPLGVPSGGSSPASPGPSQANRRHTERRRAQAANSVARSHLSPGLAPLPAPGPAAVQPGDPNLLHHLNRPGKATPPEHSHLLPELPKPSWLTNRRARPRRGTFALPGQQQLPKGQGWEGTGGDQDKECLAQCRKEQDEVEAYCTSEFAVNGIVHNTESLGSGVHWITL
ncbi:hypothetical protein N310_09998, partial [Acanthisitta chloris]